ncbi:MAG: SH3 domain-containing protein [Butyricicoccus porcorum]|uniref:SH3 domain-containing protein n=1 Tax=Butyricicoccus porcorum TaxID=1945634 RepID=UPI0023570C40|nr:SH3 domain-containing protein [Butyricicoccus porcorum]MDD6986909.1 SH3 domain-containing protein [Butyricicoccus porcorum]MDY4482746.1 SH3 domain-containing protein [Butyricicoccus porcorum]
MFQKLKKCIMVAVTGIVLTASVTAGALAANVTATTSVNVRAGAGNGYKVVTVLKKGQVVAKTGSSGNWTKVTANGKTGYVYNKYLTSGGSTTTNASKKPSASTSSTGSKTYMGNYKLTFYAGDSTTASGRTPRVNHTIAADTSILPMYSKVYIEGWGTYTVEDRGGAIKGKRIDIFVANNKIANQYGVKYADVYLVK